MNEESLLNGEKNNRNNNNSIKNKETHNGIADVNRSATNFEDDVYQAYAGGYHNSKYWQSLQTLKPVRFPKKKLPAAVDNAGLFSFITFSWLSKVITSKKTVEIDDLPSLSRYDSASFTAKRLKKLYEEDSKTHNGIPSIKRTVFRYIRTRFVVTSFVMCIVAVASFVGPAILVNKIISFSNIRFPTIGYGIGLIVALALTQLTRSLSFSAYWAISNRTAVRARSAVLTLVFEKIVRLRSLKDTSTGELVNLLTNDGQRLVDMITFGGLLVAIPLQLIAVSIYLIYLIGWTALIGVITFLFFSPFQILMGKVMANFRQKSVVTTDARVRIMNEILTYVKLIKMYAWENSFAETVDTLRNNERKVLTKTGFLSSLLAAIIPIVPVLSVAVMFLIHTLIGYRLTATEAFTALSIFNSMRFIMGLLPLIVKAVAEVLITFKRVDSLLLMEEMEKYYISTPSENIAVKFDNVSSDWDVVEKQKHGQNKKSTDSTSSLTDHSSKEQTLPVLFDINLTVEKGRLLGICGSVGSGKSSLISTVLGQLRIQQGSLSLNGTIAYVPQQAWIFHDTAKENILFGSPFDEEKYNRVVEACSLASDFEVLPDKDQTEIGERGINLSGGQKQRISLARAAYSDRDVYLLDDPLSAVDAEVGRHIFFECIKKALSGKTIIFVTHQLQYLADCDEVVLLKDGRITEHGPHDILMQNEKEYSYLINNFNIEKKEEPIEVVDHELVRKIIRQRTLSRDSSTSMSDSRFEHISLTSDVEESFKNSRLDLIFGASHSNDVVNNEKPVFPIAASGDLDAAEDINANILHENSPFVLVKSETTETGSVSTATYLTYVKAAGGYVTAFLVMLLFIAGVAGVSALNWWLTIWINRGGQLLPCLNETSSTAPNILSLENFTSSPTIESTATSISSNNSSTCEPTRDPNISTGPNLAFFQIYYFVILLVACTLVIVKSAVHAHVTLKASSGLHNQLFRSIFASPMSFFDTTPTGRILNRFSRDLDEVDSRLPFIVDLLIQQIFFLLAAFISLIVVFPWFGIAFAFLLVIFVLIYNKFRSSVRQLKRLENTTRSPWISHVTSSIQGLSTIHAYERNDETIKTFVHSLDNNTTPYYAYLCSSRWLGIRMDSLTVAITTIITLFIVFSTIYPQALGETSSSFAGLALSYAIALNGLLQITVRFSVETESLFTSVERMNEYIVDLVPEEPTNAKTKPIPSEWPKQGEIIYSGANLRYRPDLPLVLKNASFVIKPKEKIGIVGRTGSGKSSLGTALFRLVNLEGGTIVIDDMNINDIKLDDLRRNLSIIPQDPVLFVGTVRYNLDPFKKYSDDEIWKALERSHIKKMISELPEKLEAEVVENGENFSVGERQLMCMARAILRHSRIIMLDEATAAIDSETDKLVQDTIREAFADCTMLTIAHRLNTVLTSDKILVMDNGEVAEFDDPVVLLGNPRSQFSKMVQAASNTKNLQDIFEDK